MNDDLNSELTRTNLDLESFKNDKTVYLKKIKDLDSEYLNVVKIVNKYRQIVSRFEEEFGELKDSKMNKLNKDLFRKKLRGVED